LINCSRRRSELYKKSTVWSMAYPTFKVKRDGYSLRVLELAQTPLTGVSTFFFQSTMLTLAVRAANVVT
jgi:hypothetical protein